MILSPLGRPVLLHLSPHPCRRRADHSSFAQSPLDLSRLRSTVGAMLSLTFGDTEQMIATAAGIMSIHDRVRGRVGDGAAAGNYSAHDADLQRWVHATLLESSLLTYELLVGPLTRGERDRYCAEAHH